MTNLTGIRTFGPDHRFFQTAEYITVYLDLEAYAVCAANNIPIKPVGNWFGTLQSKQFPVNVRHSTFGPFPKSFSSKTHQQRYQFQFVPAAPEPASSVYFQSDTWGEVSNMFWNSTLVFFYEQHVPWIRNKFGTSQKDRDTRWPPIFRFAWALRNAAAHHHGKLNITEESVPPVIWHHLKFDHTDKGVRVLGDVMNITDVLIFLIEMSDELDVQGCPFP